MLLIAINANFNRAATQRKSESIYQKMSSSDSTHSDQGVEWIPYEDLWKIVIKHLVVDRRMAVSTIKMA